MDIEKLKRCLKCCADDNSKACNKCELEYGEEECQNLCGYATTALSALQIENQALRNAASGFKAENEKLRAELEQVKRCIEIVENQRDSAIKELENYMVQDVLDGNEPCAICAKASDTPCEYCNPKWRGQKED